jgi:uncharacterized membrane protein YdbT with pleckstrin-like domain
MFKAYRRAAERLLRIPATPEPPPGDEAATRIFRASPRFYLYLLVTWFWRTAIAFVVLVPMEILPIISQFERVLDRTPYGYGFRAPVFIVALIFLQRLFALALLRLDFEKRWYLVTNRSLRVREGVVRLREMTITFANIQNISISQGPIQRLLGIADLQVDTAGGGSGKKEKDGEGSTHGVRFRGVDNAAEIRELINTRLRELRDSGLGDRDDAQLPTSDVRSSTSTAGLVGPLREIAAEASALRGAVAAAR